MTNCDTDLDIPKQLTKSWWGPHNIRGEGYIFIIRNRLFSSFDFIRFLLFSLNCILHLSGVILQLCYIQY